MDLPSLFRTISSGVYLVGVRADERRNAFTAASIAHVSYDPLLLALAIAPEHASYRLLLEGRMFTVNVLGHHQAELARAFGTASGHDTNKLVDVRWRPGPKTGAPVFDGVIAYFECQLGARMAAGDHELVLGRVVGGALEEPGAEPLMYRSTDDMDGSRELFPPTFSSSMR